MKIGDFFDRVSQTMPLSSPGSLSAQQYADVVSFILQKSGAPAGTTELPSEEGCADFDQVRGEEAIAGKDVSAFSFQLSSGWASIAAPG